MRLFSRLVVALFLTLLLTGMSLGVIVENKSNILIVKSKNNGLYPNDYIIRANGIRVYKLDELSKILSGTSSCNLLLIRKGVLKNKIIKNYSGEINRLEIYKSNLLVKHIVEKGQNLWSISKIYYGKDKQKEGMLALAELNDIKAESLLIGNTKSTKYESLTVGAKILIPCVAVNE